MAVRPKDNPSLERNPQPKDDIRPQYPDIQVTTWPGGQRLTVDSTKGKERIRIEHPSGTYTEIYPGGGQTDFVVGNYRLAGKSGATFSVNHNLDIAAGGQLRLIIGGGAHVEITGDAGIVAGGDVLLAAGGDLKMSVDNMYMGVRGNMNINVAKNTNIRTAKNMKIETKGDAEVRTEGSMAMKTDGNMDQTTEGSTMMAAKGSLAIDAGGAQTTKGATIDHNGPGSPSPSWNHQKIPTT